MEQTNILVVDDNPEIREIIRILLEAESYRITEAADGDICLAKMSEQVFDLIILDIMMPCKNGYQTCVEIRKFSNVPILFLTAKSRESDKTLGFSSGGDDYLTKPFSYGELVNRVKALIRRYHVYRGKEIDAAADVSEDELQLGNITLQKRTRTALLNGRALDLTETEYSLLLLFALHPGQIFSAGHLYESVWEDPYYYGANNTVMVHIRNLRRKIEQDPANPTLIKTVWGKGYLCDC